MKNHLKKHHPTEYAEVLQKEERVRREKSEAKRKFSGPHKQLTLHESIDGKYKQVYDRSSEQYKSITKRLAVFVRSTNTPNSIVENVEFQKLFDPLTLDTQCQAGLCSEELDKVLFDLKATIQTFLSAARKVSLCADIWSKKGLTSSYLGITAPFSCSDHRRHCVTLAVRLMLGSHTAEHVREAVEKVMKEWEIPENKVRVIVTDNGSNMVAAFKSYFEEEDIEKETEEQDMGITDSEASTW